MEDFLYAVLWGLLLTFGTLGLMAGAIFWLVK